MSFEIKVESEEEKRIDSFLAEELDLSRNKIQKLVKQKLVKVNGKEISNNYLVKMGDSIFVDDDLNYDISVEAMDIPIDVIYEDDDLLVINKASGMVVHPAPGHYTGTLVNALLYRFQLSNKDSIRPGIVHRLDKDTSGVMLVAKNDKTHDALSKMIANKEVERHYLAIVDGVIKHDTGTIDAPIGRDANNRQKMAVTDVHGKDAITHFRVLETFSNHTLVECILETGRTHQIRVHMKHLGHPLPGDFIYCPDYSRIKRQALHAYRLEFLHPIKAHPICLTAPIPEDFRRAFQAEIPSIPPFWM